MSWPSTLSDFSGPLVLDTSVLINLHACKYGEQILRAVPNEILLAKVVARELEHETSHRNGEHSFLCKLISHQAVTIVDLTAAEDEVFFDLSSTSPSLDDGEAATIAIAFIRNLLPVVDEKEGRTRASKLLRELTPAWSLDFFLHPQAHYVLGREVMADALYFALRYGRMRIPTESANAIVAIIGSERSLDCTSLPGYRSRFRTTAH